MTNMTLADAYSIVDDNFSQTKLVNKLIEDWLFSPSLIEYWITDLDEEEEESGKWESSFDIYEWLVLPKLWDTDYEKLIQAWIPVLRTDYGNWVGTTSYGSHYDIQIYPKLIKALFNIDTDYQGIRAMKKGK